MYYNVLHAKVVRVALKNPNYGFQSIFFFFFWGGGGTTKSVIFLKDFFRGLRYDDVIYEQPLICVLKCPRCC